MESRRNFFSVLGAAIAASFAAFSDVWAESLKPKGPSIKTPRFPADVGEQEFWDMNEPWLKQPKTPLKEELIPHGSNDLVLTLRGYVDGKQVEMQTGYAVYEDHEEVRDSCHEMLRNMLTNVGVTIHVEEGTPEVPEDLKDYRICVVQGGTIPQIEAKYVCEKFGDINIYPSWVPEQENNGKVFRMLPNKSDYEGTKKYPRSPSCTVRFETVAGTIDQLTNIYKQRLIKAAQSRKGFNEAVGEGYGDEEQAVLYNISRIGAYNKPCDSFSHGINMEKLMDFSKHRIKLKSDAADRNEYVGSIPDDEWLDRYYEAQTLQTARTKEQLDKLHQFNESVSLDYLPGGKLDNQGR
jgi:hypothetical protein